MSRIKQRYYLLYANRAIIYISSLVALFFDVNLAYVLALTLWLWMPQFLQLELKIIKVIKNSSPSFEKGKRITHW